MMDYSYSSDQMTPQGSFLTSRAGLVLIGFLLTAGYFLVTEHRAHLALGVPYLPFLLLLACPLMHRFMHHGHDDRDGAQHNYDHQGGCQ